eukprot:m51a1_g11126 hypothetical protein (642) ;mRNA; r:124662-126834
MLLRALLTLYDAQARALRRARVLLRSPAHEPGRLAAVLLLPCLWQLLYTRSLEPGPPGPDEAERWFVARGQRLTVLVAASAGVLVLACVLCAAVLSRGAAALALCWSAALVALELWGAGLGGTAQSHGQFNLAALVIAAGLWALALALLLACAALMARLGLCRSLALACAASLALVPVVAHARDQWTRGLNGRLPSPKGCTIAAPLIEWERLVLGPIKAAVHTWWALAPCKPASFARIDAAGRLVVDCPAGDARYTVFPQTAEPTESLYDYVQAHSRSGASAGPLGANWTAGTCAAMVSCGAAEQLVPVPLGADPTVSAALARAAREAPRPREGRPDVVVVFLDSVSRAQFVRCLPATARWLAERAGPAGRVRQFARYHSVAGNTPRNSRALLTGREGAGEGARYLWEACAAAGYATLLADNTCAEWARKYGGRGSSPAHVAPNGLWCSRAYTGRKPDGYALLWGASSLRRRCLGGVQADAVVFAQAAQFLAMGPADLPRLALLKLSEGHEPTGAVAATLDAGLAGLLAGLDARATPTLAVLVGDHGLHMGPAWALGLGSAVAENRLPALYALLPRGLAEEQLRASRENEEALVTAADVHATLVEAAGAPGGSGGRSLLSQLLPWRGCEAANITRDWCICT